MEETIRNSIYADRENHICVARKPEETCTDWNIEYHTNCPGNDLGGSIPAPNGLDQCQDLCLQNQPECKHIALNKAQFKRIVLIIARPESLDSKYIVYYILYILYTHRTISQT